MQSSRGVSLALIQVMPLPGADLAEIEKAISTEIERTKKEMPADWEMEQAQNQTKLQAAGLQGATLSLAIYMAQDAVFFNDPGLLYSLANKVAAVKKSDVARVSTKYLTENNRTVITALPKAKAAAPSGTTTK